MVSPLFDLWMIGSIFCNAYWDRWYTIQMMLFWKPLKNITSYSWIAPKVSLAEPDTTFGFPEVRVGGLPAVDLAWLDHVRWVSDAGGSTGYTMLRASVWPWHCGSVSATTTLGSWERGAVWAVQIVTPKNYIKILQDLKVDGVYLYGFGGFVPQPCLFVHSAMCWVHPYTIVFPTAALLPPIVVLSKTQISMKTPSEKSHASRMILGGEHFTDLQCKMAILHHLPEVDLSRCSSIFWVDLVTCQPIRSQTLSCTNVSDRYTTHNSIISYDILVILFLIHPIYIKVNTYIVFIYSQQICNILFVKPKSDMGQYELQADLSIASQKTHQETGHGWHAHRCAWGSSCPFSHSLQ